MKKNKLFVGCIVALMSLCGCGEEPTSGPASVEEQTSTSVEAPVSIVEPTSEVVSVEQPTSVDEQPVSQSVVEPSAPVLTMPETTTYTVNAGEDFTLPTVTAHDYLDNDLTATIEVEDSFEKGTINNGVFNAKTAGTHMISYYVEDDYGYDEGELSVEVLPAHAETFDVTDYNDPSVMSTYGTFKENFEKGSRSPLAAITDSNGATSIVATESAIRGNSLLVDLNKTAGSAANSVFINTFNQLFHRGLPTTYTVSFKYKVVSGLDGTGDVYFGLSWDGSTGLNANFVNKASAADGQVVEFTHSFPATEIPVGGNAYFFIFKLSGSTSDVVIAFDEFVISCQPCAVVTNVVPTTAQLQAEGGFTWDFEESGSTCTNGETVVIDTIANETAKAAMKAATTKFGANALKLTNSDSHLFGGLDKTNLVAEKNIIVDIDYYAVSDGGIHLIMMDGAGNATQSPTKTVESDGITHMSFEATVAPSWNQLNIYVVSNPNFEIYIGKITAKIVEPPVQDPDKSPNGVSVGHAFTEAASHFDKSTAFDNDAAVIEDGRLGDAPAKVAFTQGNQTLEWFRGAGRIEANCTYEISFKMFVKEWTLDGNFYIRIDSHFQQITTQMTPGYHEVSFSYTPTAAVDFVSFYNNGTTANCVWYTSGFTVTLTAV